MTVNESIRQMLKRYNPKTTNDYIRALREIMQEIVLVGLWRAKFFEHAAFYGGTALRILYGLDRFSEDLDFSLLKPLPDFSLEHYHNFIINEMESFGFSVNIEIKHKNKQSNIESAFIKAGTKEELINIEVKNFDYDISKQAKFKIKLEVDINPPGNFRTESKIIKEPLPISIKTYVPADLFAGKMHVLLCRLWKNRVKGRDWYDFIWYIRKNIPLSLKHLETRMHQSGHLLLSQKLTKNLFLEMVEQKINNLNIEKAMTDIRPFISDPSILDCWSLDYFKQYMKEIVFE